MENLSYTFVTSLDEADKALTSDVFLISELSSNSQYISKKLPYTKLCSLILVDVNDKIDDRLNSIIGELSTKVDINVEDIKFLSNSIDNCVTAIVKIANCVQVNKLDIKYLSSQISSGSLSRLSCGAGIVGSATSSGKYALGHSNKKISGKNIGFLKVGYDQYGHISGSSNVSKSDITSLGIPTSDTTYGQATELSLGLVKLKSGSYSTQDRYKLQLDTDNCAYTDVPVHTIVNDAIKPASENFLGVVALCANLAHDVASNPAFAGIAEQIYPLKMADNKYAYVEVPKQAPPAIGSGTISLTSATDVISSIDFSDGRIISLGKNSTLHNRINYISGFIDDTCLLTANTTLVLDNSAGGGIGQLQLKYGDTVISYINKSQFFQDIESNINVEFVRSYTIDMDETTISKTNPAIKVTYTYNELDAIKYADIPYEDWTFTLDNGSTITKRVMTYGIS